MSKFREKAEAQQTDDATSCWSGKARNCIMPKKAPAIRTRIGYRRDERGQEQPKDKARAQHVAGSIAAAIPGKRLGGPLRAPKSRMVLSD